ncbi:MAG TPA: hypothetical protein VFC53_13245 [Dehalococcoidia bacterium]|nr:hypothetical protein [Dehalococcoidia bacterium]
MRIAGAAVLAALALAAAAVLVLAFRGDTSAPEAIPPLPTRTVPAPGATPTPLPATWRDGLRQPGDARPELLACRDANRDGRIDGGDAPDLAGLSIELQPGACPDPGHADALEAPPPDPTRYACTDAARPVLIMAFGSGGTEMLDASSGESLGLLDIVNRLQARLEAEGAGTRVSITTAALFGARTPQTAMEQWTEHALSRQLDALPCLRAVLIGHSHGGVTVTSVTAALEDRYAGRMLGVLIDRSTALYDRSATEIPQRAPLLNYFQTNEGWHGEPIDQPNVTNIDASREQAPIAPSDGGGGPALVTHKTLDDAPGVQDQVVASVLAWAAAP